MSSSSTKIEEKCPIHQKRFNYFCIDCKREMCQHCVILERHAQNNPNHLIIQNELIKTGYIKSLYNQSLVVSDILKGIDKNFPQKIDEKLEQYQKERDEKVVFLRRLALCLDKKYEEIINSLRTLKDNYSTQLNSFKTFDSKTRDIIIDYSYKKPEDRLYKDKDIEEFLKTKEPQSTPDNFIKNCNTINSVISPISTNIEYNQFTFELKNYKEILKERSPSNEMITTPVYSINFLSWQLHIYPWGSSGGKNQFVSIFLGLREGDPNESYQFLYQFQLKNFNGKDSFSTALAKKPFKAKDKFYGCEKFYKIDDLEKDGFINDEGSLIFIVLLKPENSFELKKEVDYYYNKFEKIKFVEKKK